MRTVLKGGKIYDGSASEPFFADIVIEDDKIISIEPNITPEEGDSVVELGGLSVAPGFFDAHSHNDWFAVYKEPADYFAPFIKQGITSFITGNCGLSAVGFEPNTPHIDKIGAGLFGYRGQTKGVYPTAKEFFDTIDHNTPCNIALMLGHCTARASVTGYQSAPLNDQEQQRMLAILEQGLNEGACGVSLGLMYNPGLFAPKEELREVAKLCAKHDKPMSVHARAESKVSMDYPLFGRSHLLRAMDELVEVCKGLKIKFQYSHAIFVGRKTFADKDKLHAMLADMRTEGIDAMFDIYNETLGVSVITVVMPTWYQALPVEKRRSWWNFTKLSVLVKATTILLGLDWNDLVVAYVGEKGKEWEGKSVAECAKLMGKSNVAAYLDLCEMSDWKGRINMGPYSTPEIIAWQSKQDDCLYMTDAWVEENGVQNPAIYDCYPKFLRSSLLGVGDTMPRTIRKMSGAVADRYSISQRGYLRKGYFADITIFDEQKLRDGVPDREASFGIEKVWINGTQVLDGEQLDKEAIKTTGRALRV